MAQVKEANAEPPSCADNELRGFKGAKMPSRTRQFQGPRPLWADSARLEVLEVSRNESFWRETGTLSFRAPWRLSFVDQVFVSGFKANADVVGFGYAGGAS